MEKINKLENILYIITHPVSNGIKYGTVISKNKVFGGDFNVGDYVISIKTIEELINKLS